MRNLRRHHPVLTIMIDRILGVAFDFLAAIGLMACAAMVSLYYAGFFHFLASRHKDVEILQFFFGGTP